MSANLPYALPDEPISNPKSDRLDRKAFAENLAHVICRLEREQSTVLALVGPWGSGKTSIKNLVIEELKPMPNAPRVLEFSPWQVSGTGNISSLFFEAVLGTIGQEQETPEDSRQKIRKYASWLSRGSAGQRQVFLVALGKGVRVIVGQLTQRQLYLAIEQPVNLIEIRLPEHKPLSP